jgi:hypothetical protein
VHDVHPVLLAVGLALHEEHLLGEPVGGVRLLGVAAPEVFLAEGDGGELRIGADRAQRHDLRNPLEAALLHELHAHHQVLEEERAGVLAVGPDPADACREVHDEVGPRVLEKLAGGRALDEVVVLLAGDDDLRGPAAAEFLDDVAPQEPCSARHHDAFSREGHAGRDKVARRDRPGKRATGRTSTGTTRSVRRE